LDSIGDGSGGPTAVVAEPVRAGTRVQLHLFLPRFDHHLFLRHREQRIFT
jgi:hypothetical protein